MQFILTYKSGINTNINTNILFVVLFGKNDTMRKQFNCLRIFF